MNYQEYLDTERDLDELRRRQAEVLATPPLPGSEQSRIDWLKRTYAEEQRLLALLEDE